MTAALHDLVRLSFVALVCLLGIATAPARTRANDEAPEYTQAVTLGLAEFEDRNYAEARAHFVRAHELAPNARTLRALGMVEFELKRYAESARLLREALSAREKPLDSEMRAKVEALIERAEAYIGIIVIEVVADAIVSVDDVTTPIGPNGELSLEVGDHTLGFAAPEHIAQKRHVTIRGGERSRLQVKLLPVVAPKAEEFSAAPRTERRIVKNPWLWTAVGIVVVGAAAGTAIALTRDKGGQSTELPYRGSTNVLLGAPR